MSRKKANGNLQFAVLFLILLVGIILISFIFRAFFLVKETKFDGSSHFTLRLNEKGKVQYVSFSPQNSGLGILTFRNMEPPFEIPVDASTSSQNEIVQGNLKIYFLKMIFDFKDQKEVNSIDYFRLFLFTETVKDSSVSFAQINKDTDRTKIDSYISSFFTDLRIQDEKLNIEVVNSTDISGLGNRFANLISNTGANVILVSTGDLRNTSEIQYSESSYTVDKLSKILKFKKNKISKKSLADVTIVIGKDVN